MGTTPWKGKESVREGSSYPATHLNWEEASEFCDKLTVTGRSEGWLSKDWKIALPTEAQWEYGCRAGTVTRFCFGEDEAMLGKYAWYGKNTVDLQDVYLHQIGLKQPNAWKIHDMHGSLWEWCRDSYRDQLPGGIDPDLQDKTEERVYRGGGWIHVGHGCRSACRVGNDPGVRGIVVGFRVALVPVR